MNILNIIDDPIGFITGMLISLPGILIALSAHEAAHGYVALTCGDPTAKLYGRVTLNPLKHIHPVGFLFMMLMGFGWAKPVPVNPNNFQNPRRDDLKVSLAGITANLILCLIGFLILVLILSICFSSVPVYDTAASFLENESTYAFFKNGDDYLYLLEIDGNRIPFAVEDIFKIASGSWYYKIDGGEYGIRELFIEPIAGKAVGYLYQAVASFMSINLILAFFNLIPIPPLDGYHVLNDLILKRPLFAPQKAAQVGSTILFALIMLGNFNEKLDLISIALNFVRHNIFDGLMTLTCNLTGAFGLF